MGWVGFRWTGVVLLLAAYLLRAGEVITPNGAADHLLNTAGSVFLIANSLSLKPRDWAVAVFNIFWAAVGLYGLWKLAA